MKLLRTIAFALVLAGCTPEQCSGRTINGGIGTAHQVKLELCLDQAQKAHDAGVPDAKVEADYKACADAADASSGKK